ncbi:MAG: molybdopterin-synthase adenylyltransferase MoeB, partial [Clostridiales Family XIII bacterium]|nr:molybdopterin-synthase adenylyltransferase MoeB [Clostridiales Family XIII bacterium]
EIARYDRHLSLPEVGAEGQRRLKAARVLVVGAGGLGAPLAIYLAAAGVGTLGIADFDFVEASNLQRQILHGTKDVGRRKVASARDRIESLNPYVRVVEHTTRLTSENALDILRNYDVVADGSDNYPTRYLVNDACALLGLPNVYGAVARFEGQVSVFCAKEGPCYRCLYPDPPPPGLIPSCAEGGVMGVLPGIVGTIQAAEVIKLILGGDGGLIGRFLLFDAWRMRFRELKLERNPSCPVCGEKRSVRALMDYERFCGLGQSGEDAPVETLTALELRARLDAGDPIQLIDIREPHERDAARFPNAKAIPLGRLTRRMDEFDQGVDAVILCGVGQRSLYAIRALREAGYAGRLFNLRGGVDAWTRGTGADPS